MQYYRSNQPGATLRRQFQEIQVHDHISSHEYDFKKIYKKLLTRMCAVDLQPPNDYEKRTTRDRMANQRQRRA